MSVCLTNRAGQGQGRAGRVDIFSYWPLSSWPLSSSSANSKHGRAGQDRAVIFIIKSF